MKLTWEEVQSDIESCKDVLDECMSGGRNCATCASAKRQIAELESEYGTVAPEHRAKSFGKLAR